jgi:hypothetical protein
MTARCASRFVSSRATRTNCTPPWSALMTTALNVARSTLDILS